MSEAAFELHSSRLVALPSKPESSHALNDLDASGMPFRARRSSPPAEKCAVCIGEQSVSQGQRARSVAGKCPQYRGFQSPCRNAARAAFCAKAYGNVEYSSQSHIGRPHVGNRRHRDVEKEVALTTRIDARHRSRNDNQVTHQSPSVTHHGAGGTRRTPMATWQP